MPSFHPTLPLPTTTTAPSLLSCPCAFALTRAPIRSTNQLCHALSHYPEVAGMVVGFWNGEVRIRRILKGLFKEIKEICAVNKRGGKTTQTFRDQLDVVLQQFIGVTDTPTGYTLSQVLLYLTASVRHILTHWTNHLHQPGDHGFGESISRACSSLAAKIRAHRELATSFSGLIAEMAPLEPPFLLRFSADPMDIGAYTPHDLLRAIGRFDIPGSLNQRPDGVIRGYWTLPWETASSHSLHPRPRPTPGDGTISVRLSMSELLSGRVDGSDLGWTGGESGEGEGLVAGGHGLGWST